MKEDEDVLHMMLMSNWLERVLLEHLARPRSPELNQMVHQYVLHLRRHKYHVRMQWWLLAQEQLKHQAHLLGVSVAK